MTLIAWVIVIAGLIHVGLLLTVAALFKLKDIRGFAFYLATQGLLPDTGVAVAARVVPAAELLVGIWLLTGFMPALAALVGALVLAVFLGYRIVLFVVSRHDGSCGCFGSVSRTASTAAETVALVVNIAIACFTAWVSMKMQITYPEWTPAAIAAASVAACAVALGYRRDGRRVIGQPAQVTVELR